MDKFDSKIHDDNPPMDAALTAANVADFANMDVSLIDPFERNED